MSPVEPDFERDEDFLAADYALGTLTAAEMRRAERRMRDDAVFAAEVAAWQLRLSPLFEAIEPEPARSQVWERILADLPRAPRIVRSPAAAPAPGRRLVSAIWQWLAIGSAGLAAASLAALLVLVPAGGPPANLTLTAAIAGEDGTPLYAAVIDPATGRATLLPLVVSSDAAHSHELWLIGADGVPASLGLLDPAAPRALEIGGDRIGADAAGTLAVSVEPLGGSPTGQPTGPVVATGPLRSI